jgi:hypothetical protein
MPPDTAKTAQTVSIFPCAGQAQPANNPQPAAGAGLFFPHSAGGP